MRRILYDTFILDDNRGSMVPDPDDDNTWQHRMPPRPKRDPLLEPLESCWQVLHSASGHVLSCGIFRTKAGLEVRAGYSDAQLLRSQLVQDMVEGRALAEEWRRATATHGAFTALSGEPLA